MHDELLFEVPHEAVEETRELIRARMESAAELDVPLKVEGGVGDNWLECK